MLVIKKNHKKSTYKMKIMNYSLLVLKIITWYIIKQRTVYDKCYEKICVLRKSFYNATRELRCYAWMKTL